MQQVRSPESEAWASERTLVLVLVLVLVLGVERALQAHPCSGWGIEALNLAATLFR